MTRISRIVLILIVISAVIAAGCTTSRSNTPGITGATESGKITVSGAFALYPIMVKWAEEYQKINPGVKVEVSAGGAGKGMTDALSGMVDLGMVSRDISQEEISNGAVYVAVTKDAVVVTANANNPVLADLQTKGINRSVFTQIFVNETITDWGTVVHRPELSEKINVYTRSDACGAADVWAKYMGYKQEDLKGVGVYGDPGLADAVKSDRLGVGYNNIGFAYDATTGKPLDGLAIIPLDLNDNGRIDTDEQLYATRDMITNAINTGKYPSPPARELNLVAKDNFSGPSLQFVRWILTDGQKYVRESGYIALPKERINQQLNKLTTG
jgi:phosphate transport system substrate-binding protein